MARVILYIGPTGSGKSSAIRTLDPKSTFIIQSIETKDLPWKGSAKQYKLWDKETSKGNLVKTSKAKVILTWLDHINKNMPEIKDIVLDDYTFVTAFELQGRSGEKDWKRFTDVVDNLLNTLKLISTMRSDLVVHMMNHTQVTGDGILEDKYTRAMSYGKLIDEKLGQLEAHFTIVLLAQKVINEDEIKYGFITKDGNSSAKAPLGMFEDAFIPNDLALVRNTVMAYYEGE